MDNLEKIQQMQLDILRKDYENKKRMMEIQRKEQMINGLSSAMAMVASCTVTPAIHQALNPNITDEQAKENMDNAINKFEKMSNSLIEEVEQQLAK